MKVHLAGLSETETIHEVKPFKKEDGILEMVKKNNNKIITFNNKLPKWNEGKFIYLFNYRTLSICFRF